MIGNTKFCGLIMDELTKLVKAQSGPEGLYTIIAVLIIVGAAMLYSSPKVKKENIIDALKQENI